MSGRGPGEVELPTEVVVANVGLGLFAEAVRAQGRPVVQVDWRIPAGGDREAVAALTRLHGRLGPAVEAANAEVVRRLDHGTPLLVDVAPTAEVVPDLGDRTVLHPGPPIEPDDLCDPLARSVRAAVMAEGWAATPEEAAALVAEGAIDLVPANPRGVVVPMASAIGPSAPMLVVDNEEGRTRAFAPLNQGPGDVAWFGRDTPGAVDRLVLLREVVGPLLARCLRANGPVDLLALAAQGLHMGDDLHLRTQATTNLLYRVLLAPLMAIDDARRAALGSFLAGNHLFFLNLAMAAAKSLTMWAEQVEGSSVVTTMARNGTTYGVRLPGSDRWHLAPAPPITDALYQPGFGPDDAAPDIGDSAVLELVGLGGCAAAASPAVAAFVGGSMEDAIATTEDVDHVCVGRSRRFTLPVLGFRGTPLGVDVRKVVELGITPKVTTGILHARDGSGQIGAGVAHAPADCFLQALLDLDRRLGQQGGSPAA